MRLISQPKIAGKVQNAFSAKLREWLKPLWTLSLLLTPFIGSHASVSPSLGIGDLLEVSDITNVTVAPNEKVAAFRVERPDVSNNVIRLTWYLVSLDGSEPAHEIGSGGDPIWNGAGLTDPERAIWSADSRTLYFRALHGQKVQVWRASPYSARSEPVTNDAADVEAFTIDPADGHLFYTVRATRDEIRKAEGDEYNNGIILDPTVQTRGALLGNFPYHGRMVTIRQGLQPWPILLVDRPPIVKVLNLPGKEAHEASEADLVRYKQLEDSLAVSTALDSSHAVRSPDDSRLAFFEKLDAPGSTPEVEPRYVLKWASSSSKAKPVACPASACFEAKPTPPQWAEDGTRLLFVSVLPDGESVLHEWNIESDVVRNVVTIRGLIGQGTGNRRWAIAGQLAICTTATESRPPQLESINWKSGMRRVLFDPNQGLRAKIVSAAEQLSWTDKWGRSSTGVLLLPPVRQPHKRLPLVITSYRCRGFLRGGVGSDVPEHVLAMDGFAALCVNFNDANAREAYPDKEIAAGQETNLQTLLDSWEAAVDLLDQKGLIDPTRVGISGLSLGAEGVLYAVSHSRRFAVAAAGQPPFTDPINYYSLVSSGDLGARLLAVYGLPPLENDPNGVWKSMSPSLNAQHIAAPVLIQTNEGEFRFGLQFWAAMVAAHKPIEFIVFPEEGHQFMQPLHRLIRNTRYVDWFRFWLQGYEDQSPDKRSQYVRWRDLKGLASQAKQ